jgi:hypothetical protein
MLSALNSLLTPLLQYSVIQQVELERRGTVGCFRVYAGSMLRRQARKVDFVVIDGKKIAAPGAKKRGRIVKSAEAFVVFSIRIA